MTINEVKKIILPVLREKGVIRSSIFGSLAKGEADKDSDIDLLVELPEDRSLFDLVDLKMALERRLGKKVDVLTYRSIHPLLRNAILSNQIPIL